MKGNVITQTNGGITVKDLKYYLIFKDKDNTLVRVVEDNLNKIYEIITKYNFPEGSYMIIKGEKII